MNARPLAPKIAILILALTLPATAVRAEQTCSEIVSNEISFQFDRAYSCGQFVNGDWWVTPDQAGGKVRITKLEPSPYTSGCAASGHHGFERNPTVSSSRTQSFDDRVGGTTFKAPACLPLDVAVGQSVVKVKSWNTSQDSVFCEEDSSTFTCVESAAILTVLADPAPEDAFRPPYVAGDKPLFRIADLDLQRLARLPLHPDAPSLSAMAAMLGGPWLDHVQGFASRYIHSRQGLLDPKGKPADYGAELMRLTAMATLRTLHDEPDSEKLQLVVPLVQSGIDLYYKLLAGRRWVTHAGHENGRKLPILYAGLLLGHSGMLGIGTTHGPVPGDCTRYFSEDGQTFIGEGGVALWGDSREGLCGCGGKFGGIGDSRGDYDDNFPDRCDGRRKSCRDPDGLNDGGWRSHGDLGSQCVEQSPPTLQISRGQWEQSSYQYCCTTAGLIGTAIAARLLGVEDEWKHPAFFQYTDRMAGPPWNGAGAYGHPYMAGMFAEYRSCAGGCPGQRDDNLPEPPYVH